MKIEFNIETQELEERIIQRVIAALLPFLQGKGGDELLTIDQTAEYLGKSKGQIYQWVSNSRHGLYDLPFQKAGRELRFSKNDLNQWMKNNGKKR